MSSIQKDYTKVINAYLKVIKAFKNRHDVNSGTAIGYRKNQDPNGYLAIEDKPHSIGEGLTTTGWCVSTSQALINDPAFKTLQSFRGAQSKLISVDIKEQYYGKVYNGSNNYWHTAVLVEDDGFVFVIDLTCAQFGNAFVEKFIWNFETWEHTFRKVDDVHIIYDFNNNPLTTYNKTSNKYDSSLPIYGIESRLNSQTANIQTITDYLIRSNIDQKDAKYLAEYFVYRFKPINSKLTNDILSPKDINYIESIQSIIDKMDMIDLPPLKEGEYVVYYCVIPFDNRMLMDNWISRFINNGCTFDHYAYCYRSLEEAVTGVGVNLDNLRIPNPQPTSKHYLVIKIHITNNAGEYTNDVVGAEFHKPGAGLLCYGQQLIVDEENIYDSSKDSEAPITDLSPAISTNTFYMVCK